jgi:hypothetical protein
MSKEIRKQYTEETGKDGWASESFDGHQWNSTGSYSNDYVKWLEEKCSI